MNYGTHVRALLTDLARDADQPTLPAYNHTSVAAALQDFSLHVQALHDQVEAAAAVSQTDQTRSSARSTTTSSSDVSVRPSIVLQNAACRRHKRGLLAYHWERVRRVQELWYWQDRREDGTAHDTDTPRTTTHLCPAEIEFLHTYQTLVADYTRATLGDASDLVDLRSSATAPPLTVDKVACRVVRPVSDETNDAAGAPIVLESGQTVALTVGSTHYLNYTDVQEYLASGDLVLVDTEEPV